jgi:hypothetical protein
MHIVKCFGSSLAFARECPDYDRYAENHAVRVTDRLRPVPAARAGARPGFDDLRERSLGLAVACDATHNASGGRSERAARRAAGVSDLVVAGRRSSRRSRLDVEFRLASVSA